MFLFCCYVVFQLFWTHSHSQRLPSVELRKCCQESEVFDRSKDYQCVSREPDSYQDLTVKVSDGNSSSSHSLNLKFAENLSEDCNQYHKVYFQLSIWKIVAENEEYIYFIDNYNNNPHSYNPDEFCVDIVKNDSNTEQVLIAQQCLPCSEEKPCVNYCCEENYVLRDNMCKQANETEDDMTKYESSDIEHKWTD